MSTEKRPSQACPAVQALSAWLDGELDSAASESVCRHVEECSVCRERLLAWVEVARQLAAPSVATQPPVTIVDGNGHPGGLSAKGAVGRLLLPGGAGWDEGDELLCQPVKGGRTAHCLDAETLVAYSEVELDAVAAAVAERHLQTCTECVAEVQRLVTLRRALAEEPAAERAAARTLEAPHVDATGRVPRGWLIRLDDWLRAIADLVRPRWAAIGGLAATAVLILTLARLAPVDQRPTDVQFRGAAPREQVKVIATSAAGRARPGDSEQIVVTLERGTVGLRLEALDDWTRIELADGRRVWVQSAELARTEGMPDQ